jgi:hypothetical protein
LPPLFPSIHLELGERFGDRAGASHPSQPDNLKQII